MRQLRAEMRKLRRPLVYWLAVALVVLSALIVQSRQSGAAQYRPTYGHGIPSVSYSVPTCKALGLPPGPKCDREQLRIIHQQQRHPLPVPHLPPGSDTRSVLRRALLGQSPIGAGRDAVGFATSPLGALIVFLLAAGHVGGEFSGRTMRNVLAQEPRRWRVLLAKWASLWLASALILALVWATLATLSFAFRALYPLEGFAPLGISRAASIAVPDVLRGLLVLAAYSALGLAAAIITRNALGTFVVGMGAYLVLLMGGQNAAFAGLNPARWVVGWMGWPPDSGIASDYFWNLFLQSGAEPTRLAGLLGFCGLLAVSGLISYLLFRRDIGL